MVTEAPMISCLFSNPVYYRFFGDPSALQSRQPFDPEDPTIGRVSRNKLTPPRTVGIIKRYIAQVEGFRTSQLTGIYINPEDAEPIPDNTRLGQNKARLAVRASSLLPSL